MNLNIHSWRYFKISNLFEDFTGGDLIISEIKQGTIPIASNSAKNNNIAAYSDVIPNRKLFDHRISISIADRGRFWAFIQPKDFYIGTRAKALVSKNTHITVNQLVFITTIINRESFKFCYGRNCCDNLPNILIKLPIQHNKDGSVLIDNSHDFSDDGYIPDWQFMEDYIKSLHHKPLTTKKLPSQTLKLSVNEWKEFTFGDLLSAIYKAKAINKDELSKNSEKGNSIRYITRTSENNGCEMLVVRSEVTENLIEKGNAITIGDTTATCFYQDEKFITGDHMVVVRADSWLNKYTGLFVVTILQCEQYKYSYGRAFIMEKIKNTIIKLPAITKEDGTYEPDWEYMENYIKSLPYGDRI